ncbi:hypothetical protein EVAR_99043_1 [Eumeta japonica]|uniref:Uncharacterized protein n=1 Tax=Eumeta variegata TaxID=151549 RepID=A0A4C1Y1E7_EUMVA|nr:hypothetical protein EVAR_99043_1 [Eumeta japonica]
MGVAVTVHTYLTAVHDTDVDAASDFYPGPDLDIVVDIDHDSRVAFNADSSTDFARDSHFSATSDTDIDLTTPITQPDLTSPSSITIDHAVNSSRDPTLYSNSVTFVRYEPGSVLDSISDSTACFDPVSGPIATPVPLSSPFRHHSRFKSHSGSPFDPVFSSRIHHLLCMLSQ